MSKPILGYWNIRGYGQPLKFLLAHAGVDYEEKVYVDDGDNSGKRAEWFNEKYKLGLHFANIPYWIDGELKLTEVKAILKYLARKYDAKLVPTDNLKLTKCEMLESYVMEVLDTLDGLCYVATDDIRAAFPEASSGKLSQLSKFLGENKFGTGNELTYVDFLMYETLYHYNTHDTANLKPFPNLQKYLKSFEAVPQIAAYISKSPRYIKGPCFSTSIKITQF